MSQEQKDVLIKVVVCGIIFLVIFLIGYFLYMQFGPTESVGFRVNRGFNVNAAMEPPVFWNPGDYRAVRNY